MASSTRASIMAKLRPMHERGLNVKGQYRCDCGLLPVAPPASSYRGATSVAWTPIELRRWMSLCTHSKAFAFSELSSSPRSVRCNHLLNHPYSETRTLTHSRTHPHQHTHSHTHTLTHSLTCGKNSRSGLNISTSGPQSLGFMCRAHSPICICVPFGSKTFLPPRPFTSVSNMSCRNVPVRQRKSEWTNTKKFKKE